MDIHSETFWVTYLVIGAIVWGAVFVAGVTTEARNTGSTDGDMFMASMAACMFGLGIGIFWPIALAVALIGGFGVVTRWHVQRKLKEKAEAEER